MICAIKQGRCRSVGGDVEMSVIYHLLRVAFGQCITIPKVVHFDIFDEVPVLLIDLAFTLRLGR